MIADPDVADLLVQFEDATHSAPVPSAVSGARRVINRDCLDVSKSRVAEVFAQVFGYHLDVDPQAHQGLVVVKSETNGAHDGRIVSCPTPREDGLVYQRLIDNRLDAELVEDIRCPTVHGTIPVVFLKRRSVSTRFANYNSEVVMTQADAVFSPAERARISDFCRAMQLDWGGLDVLRDRSDGRLYIVDVNKTDMGPPTALALTDQIAAVERLGAAFTEKFLIAPERGARATPGHAARQQDVVS